MYSRDLSKNIRLVVRHGKDIKNVSAKRETTGLLSFEGLKLKSLFLVHKTKSAGSAQYNMSSLGNGGCVLERLSACFERRC